MKSNENNLGHNQKNSKNATSDNRFYKMGLRDSDTYSWTLGGRIDGLDKDTGELIEIKNRINRLFYKLRDYEKVQIFIYMKLLDKQEATLIENFKDEMNTILIKWDEKFWQTEVLDKISVFMNEFEQFVQSKEKKMRLLEYLIEQRDILVGILQSTHTRTYSQDIIIYSVNS